RRRRFTWILLSQHAHVVDVADGRITLGLANTGARDNFLKGGSEDILVEALVEAVGTRFSVQAIVDPGDGPGGRARGGDGGAGPTPPTPPPAPSVPPASAGPPAQAGPSPAPAPEPAPAQAPAGPPPGSPASPGHAGAALARESIRTTRHAPRQTADHNGASAAAADGDDIAPDEDVDRDDAVLDDGFGSHTELLAQHLGAEVIEDDPQP